MPAAKKKATKKARNGALYFQTEKIRNAALKKLRGQGFLHLRSYTDLNMAHGRPRHFLTGPGTAKMMQDALLGTSNPWKPTPDAMYADMLKQGIWKGPKTTRGPKAQKPVEWIACNKCGDYHPKGKHTKKASKKNYSYKSELPTERTGYGISKTAKPVNLVRRYTAADVRSYIKEHPGSYTIWLPMADGSSWKRSHQFDSAASSPAPAKAKKARAKKKTAQLSLFNPNAKTGKPAGHKAKCKCPFCKRARTKTNPDTAEQLYEDFHGKPSTRIREITQREEYPVEVADLGRLTRLEVYIDGDSHRTNIDAKGNIRVVSTPDGSSIYFLSGDQSLDLEDMGLGYMLPKDHVTIGDVHTIHYHTRKGFHNFEPTTYYHKFGEANGARPLLNYDTRNKRIYLTGGTYQVKPEGIVN